MTAVTIERRGHVAILCFSARPNNHLSIDSLTEIVEALAALDADPEVRAVVLRSEGRVFCAGADLSGRAQGEEAARQVKRFYAQAAKLFANRKPIVAAIQGAAVGAGLGLALAADFRIAAPEARLTANFVKLGFHPGFGMTRTLARIIGEQQAALLLLTGRRLKGDEAHAIGLVDEVVPAEVLLDRATALAAEIAANAPIAVQDTRATLRRGLVEGFAQITDHEAEIQARHRQTSDFLEGVSAAAERREPNFSGS